MSDCGKVLGRLGGQVFTAGLALCSPPWSLALVEGMMLVPWSGVVVGWLGLVCGR